MKPSPTSVTIPPLWLLVAFTCVGPVAINIFLPSMGSMATEFAVPYQALQPSISLYILGVAVGQLLYGPLSDSFGRRPLMRFGGLVFMLANIALFLAPTLEWLFVGRILQAIGGCSGIVLTRAILRDCYPEDKVASAMGYITMSMVIAPALAPLIGGLIDEAFNWRATFLFLAMFGVLQLALATWRLPETNPALKPRIDWNETTRGLGSLLRDPAFMAYALCCSFSLAAYFSFLSAGPYAVKAVFGGTPTDYGLYSLVPALGYALGNGLSGRYAARLGSRNLMLIGCTIFLAGSLVLVGLWLADVRSVWSLFGAIAITVIGTGMLFPGASAGAMALRPDNAGSASALLGLLPTLIAAALAELTGRLLAMDLWSFIGIYTGCAAGSLGCGLAALYFRRTTVSK
jgi:MFS transporter, DHA1 family, multidrug resistance protein